MKNVPGYPYNFTAGFTLIELLVVTTIMAALVGIGIANYNNFNNNQSVKQAAMTVKNNIRFAQSQASSSLKPAGCAGANTLSGYEVGMVDSSTYRVRASCSDGNFYNSTNYKLPQNITFSGFPGNILFRTNNRGVTNAGDIFVTGPDSIMYKITVSGSGDVDGPIKQP